MQPKQAPGQAQRVPRCTLSTEWVRFFFHDPDAQGSESTEIFATNPVRKQRERFVDKDVDRIDGMDVDVVDVSLMVDIWLILSHMDGF